MKAFLICASLATAVALAACGDTKFAASDPSLDLKSAGATANGGDATGELQTDEDGDAAGMLTTVPTVAEFVGMLGTDPALTDPATAALVIKAFRCYISHGGGHGVELCMPGDKSALSGISPIEIKGDQLCVHHEDIVANPDLFVDATFGRCGQ